MEGITFIYFLLILGVIACLYASIGHGGASGYLALMAVFAFPIETMRSSALVLNLFVSGTSFILFYKNSTVSINKIWPFVICSVPMAFLGGTLSVDPDLYKKLLGGFILIATVKIVWSPKAVFEIGQNIWAALLVGALIGFFSGLIGIGGGIILSPVLLLLGWGNSKEIAAITAIFIFVNSLAGLGGITYSGILFSSKLPILIAVAFIGGLIGSNYGSKKWSINNLRYVLSFVLFGAGIKLLFL